MDGRAFLFPVVLAILLCRLIVFQPPTLDEDAVHPHDGFPAGRTLVSPPSTVLFRGLVASRHTNVCRIPLCLADFPLA